MLETSNVKLTESKRRRHEEKKNRIENLFVFCKGLIFSFFQLYYFYFFLKAISYQVLTELAALTFLLTLRSLQINNSHPKDQNITLVKVLMMKSN